MGIHAGLVAPLAPRGCEERCARARRDRTSPVTEDARDPPPLSSLARGPRNHVLKASNASKFMASRRPGA